MIYTVTFNPALDYTIFIKDLTPGRVNRTREERFYPGGKGLNVSLMLKRLGHDSMALGFSAGFTGDELERLLRQSGCQTGFIRLPKGDTRINVKIKSTEETDLNARGPDIPPEAMDALFSQLDGLSAVDFLVLAGSVPSSLPSNIYEKILARLSHREVQFVVDATGALLLNVLKYRPFLIKPNHHELGELFGRELIGREEIITKARELQHMGARNVLVSMAGDGALLLDENGGVHQTRPPEGRAVNSVGAGDSMVAGFLCGWLESGGSFPHAFRMGVCTGSATAFGEWLASREAVEALLERLP